MLVKFTKTIMVGIEAGQVKDLPEPTALAYIRNGDAVKVEKTNDILKKQDKEVKKVYQSIKPKKGKR